VNTWYAIAPKAENKQTEISIFDEIGMFGVSAKQFISDLQSVPADHSILLKIHSPGGEVFDGNAIFNALQRRGNVEVQIEGIAASMATVISLAGAPVKMAANGFYMIHNPWGVAMGDAEELRDQAELLDKIRSNMVGAYAARSGKSPEQIQEWMDAETWFTAEEAHAAGFVDEVTDRLALAASANQFARLAKFKNAPANLTAPSPRMSQEKETPASDNPLTEIIETLVESDMEAVPPVMNDSDPVEPKSEEIVPIEEPAIEPPAAPVAHIAAADSILSKFNAALAERDAARAEVVAYKTQLDTTRAELASEREALERLERSLGLQAAAVVPLIQPQSDTASDPVAEYLAAVEAGDRKAASALFEKHKAAIWQHRNKISKA
jgi:ATP-dependent Clp endopeptidase proteolytic subunit ClpP